jgi:hypothetical protein
MSLSVAVAVLCTVLLDVGVLQLAVAANGDGAASAAGVRGAPTDGTGSS